MKIPGYSKYLAMSAVAVIVLAASLSMFMMPVQGDDDGGIHGERDDGHVDIECSRVRYKVGEVVNFKVINRFNETIFDPLPAVHNDEGVFLNGWVRADVMPVPTLPPGHFSDYYWDQDVLPDLEVTPGRYYISVHHNDIEYIQEFWIYEPAAVDPAEIDEISDGFEGDVPFLIGPNHL
ncbi:MAG: hypothetical protein ACMUHY_08830 [Thermoplasmatota archaeon]